MKIAYVDCFAGVSGDMLLGALLSAGVGPRAFARELARLGLKGWRLDVKGVQRGPIRATKATVILEEGAAGRHGLPAQPRLADVEALIGRSRLPEAIKARSLAVFRRLAAAEARVHGTRVEQVHFHEVGALDAIIDVVGTVTGLAMLGVEELQAAPVPLGRGLVQGAHGVLPVPAPATVELLQDVPVTAGPVQGELTTPTGAALLVTLAARFGCMPPMTLRGTGYGAGSAEREVPNLLRLMLGETVGGAGEDVVRVLEFAVDDGSGEALGHLVESCLAAGALDVYSAGVTMKKSRPGVHVTVLAPLERADAVARVVFRETTTFGLRERTEQRRVLARILEPVQTAYGEVHVKVGRLGEETVTVAPEYEDCRRLAEQRGVPFKEVQAAAVAAWRARGPQAPDAQK